MSLIEESLRRKKDPTMDKVKTAPQGAPAGQTPAHSWKPSDADTVGQDKGRRSSGWLLAIAVALVAVAGWQLWGSREQILALLNPPTAPAPRATSVAAAPVPATAPVTPQPAPQPKAAAHNKGPVLEGVVLGGSSPLALISGEVYKSGDKLGKATIVAIEAKRVVLQKSSGDKTVLALAE